MVASVLPEVLLRVDSSCIDPVAAVCTAGGATFDAVGCKQRCFLLGLYCFGSTYLRHTDRQGNLSTCDCARKLVIMQGNLWRCKDSFQRAREF